MYLDDIISSDNQVNQAALRSTANGALFRAAGIALRLAGFAKKHIGNGIDGANDLIAAKQAAIARAAALNMAGKDSMPLELQMHRLMALYLSLSARLTESEWYKPMTLDEALDFISSEREVGKDDGAELLAAIAKISGESVEQLRERQSKLSKDDAERNRDLAPLAKSFLEECGDTGESEDQIFQDLPVNTQFALFCNAVDKAANQFERDLNRSLKFVNSKSAVLRSLTVSDVAAGKDALNQLEAQLAAFAKQHRNELDL